MLSIQGLIAKDLKRQNKLPEKWNDMTLEPNRKNIGEIISVYSYTNKCSKVNLNGSYNICSKVPQTSSSYKTRYAIFNPPSTSAISNFSGTMYPTAMDTSKDWELKFKIDVKNIDLNTNTGCSFFSMYIPSLENGTVTRRQYPHFALREASSNIRYFAMGKTLLGGPGNSSSSKRVLFIYSTNSSLQNWGVWKFRCVYTASTNKLVVYGAYGEDNENYTVYDTVTVYPSNEALGTGKNYVSISIGSSEYSQASCAFSYLRDLEIINDGKLIFQRV